VADALSTAVVGINRPLLNSYYAAKLEGRSAQYPEVAKR
jgi:hypothetical protein